MGNGTDFYRHLILFIRAFSRPAYHFNFVFQFWLLDGVTESAGSTNGTFFRLSMPRTFSPRPFRLQSGDPSVAIKMGVDTFIYATVVADVEEGSKSPPRPRPVVNAE